MKDLKSCDVRVFCDKDEYMYYEQVAGDRAVIGADQGKPDGLIQQLNFIKEYAIEHKYDVIWKIDDKCELRKGNVSKKDIVPYIEKYVEEIKQKFKEGADAIGTCKSTEYRFAQQEGFIKRIRPFDASYFIKTELFGLDPEVFSMDELQVYFKLAVLGRTNVYTAMSLYIDNPMGKHKGGLQSFDRLKESKKSWLKLVSTYTHIKEKKNIKSTDIDIGWRIDYSYYRELYKNS